MEQKKLTGCQLKREAQLKDLDEQRGIVSGYFASFGTVDAHGDVFNPKAFNRSIEHFNRANNSRIQHLYMHSEPVGKLTELGADEKGLFFTSRLSNSTLGKDVLLMYKEGILREHSVGFFPIEQEQYENHNEILEAKLMEGSTVIFGANPNTPVTSVKSLSENVELIDNFFSFVTKAYNSNISEETRSALFNKVKSLYDSLTRESTQTEQINIFENFINRLK